jgi:hypothetical protein
MHSSYATTEMVREIGLSKARGSGMNDWGPGLSILKQAPSLRVGGFTVA